VGWRIFVSLLRLTFSGHTDGVVGVLSAAWRIADARGHSTVTPEHLLAGLAATEYGPNIALLDHLGLPLRARAAEIAKLVGPKPEGSPSRCRNISPEVRDVMARARASARAMDHHYIGIGHLILSLISCTDSSAAACLRGCGAGEEVIRSFLAGEPVQPGDPADPPVTGR
jgi:ATP-dependent Clp protease ATP-binding subunit ClpA